MFHVICQKRAWVLHHGFQTPSYRRKHEAVGFELFGTRDEAWSPRFLHVFSNDAIRNNAVTCLLWYCIVSMSCVTNMKHPIKMQVFDHDLRWKTCFISVENVVVFYLVFHDVHSGQRLITARVAFTSLYKSQRMTTIWVRWMKLDTGCTWMKTRKLDFFVLFNLTRGFENVCKINSD